MLETGGDGRFSATSFGAVLIWSLGVNNIAGDVVDANNNTLF